MKKTLKISVIVFTALIILLISIPFLFKGSIEKLVLKSINENLNAQVQWEKLDLSLFRNFPDASLKLQNFSVINKAPFEGDTLAKGTLNLEMGLMQLFKSKDLKIDAFHLEDALVNIKVDSSGVANYDIALKDDAPVKEDTPDSDNFKLNLQNYTIKNSRINYADESSKMFFALTNFEHRGKGDLSEDITNLDTHSEANISFAMDGTEYLSNHRLTLDAVLELDLNQMKFSFLENEGKINELPLVFNGFFQMHENHNEIDLTFSTPSSDFKNFLAIIPKEYVKQIEDVKTTGNFMVNGIIKGNIDEEHIPTMNIKVHSNDASFKYPDLPMAVQNITIDAQLMNETGLLKDTYLNVPNLTFTVDGSPFRMKALVKNFMENAIVAMEMQGTINLANLEKILPLELESKPEGIFKADFAANFDMESVEKERYDRIDARGNASLSKFKYDGGFKNQLQITQASVSMNPNLFRLNELQATTGTTDFNVSGSLHNLFAFLMKKQNLKGSFALNSNNFNVSDFMTDGSLPEKTTSEKTETPKTTPQEAIKVPDFLDANFDFNAKTVVYDNITLKNAKGTATIKDETVSIKNFTSDLFGGRIAFDGNVSTKEATPTFGMTLDLSKIDIVQSFREMEMLQFLAPIAQALQGSLNTKFNLSGKLDNELSPVMSSLTGDAVAEIISAQVDPQKAPVVSQLQDKMAFLNLHELNLKNVSTHFSFNNGQIEVKPFHFDAKGVDVAVSGTHGLDKSMNYNLNIDVPAKYLGNDITKLLRELDPAEAEKAHIVVPVGITGSFNQPKVSLNMESAIKELTNKLVKKEKDKLIDKGKDFLGGLLDGGKKKDSIPASGTTKPDSTKTKAQQQVENKQQQVEDKIKGALDGILKGKKRN